jgi:hypothetical protein
LCTNPCTTKGFIYYSYKNKICFNDNLLVTKSENGGSYACDTWCTMDVNNGSGCGDNQLKLCVNPCKNSDYPWYSEVSKLCYATKA